MRRPTNPAYGGEAEARRLRREYGDPTSRQRGRDQQKQDSGSRSGQQGRIPAELWSRKEFPTA